MKVFRKPIIRTNGSQDTKNEIIIQLRWNY